MCNTPRNVKLVNVDPGQYCHLGLSFSISKLLADCLDKVKSVKLLIGIDGLPLFSSSSDEFWPILGSIINLPELQSKVFPIGVYYGLKKPAGCIKFSSQFTEEIISVIKNGLTIDGKNILVRLKGICCDAPAKAFILGTQHHNEYFSCTRCKQEGSFFNNRMTFPLIDCAPRTHEGSLSQEDEDFNISNTPLTAIPNVDFVRSIPLDYMHLVCLGVMRTMHALYLDFLVLYPISYPPD